MKSADNSIQAAKPEQALKYVVPVDDQVLQRAGCVKDNEHKNRPRREAVDGLPQFVMAFIALGEQRDGARTP